MPDIRSAYWIRHGGEDTKARFAVYLATVPLNSLPYCGTWKPTWLTSEELPSCASKPELWGGIGFSRMLDISEIFPVLDFNFPTCKNKISRSFWGMWNAPLGPQQWSWKRGAKHRTLKNPFYNPIWALTVTSRVKMRLAEHRAHMLHCFVDSMLSTREVETGEQPGQWRLQGQYDGVIVYAPGRWARKDGQLIKHAGTRG